MEYPSIVAPFPPPSHHTPAYLQVSLSFQWCYLHSSEVTGTVRVTWPAFKIEHNDPHQSLNLDTQI